MASNPLDLAAIEAALAKATPGPWKREGLMVWAPDAQAVVCACGEPRPSCGTVRYEQATFGSKYLDEAFANATLIAELPALLAAARERDRLREALEYVAAESEDEMARDAARKALRTQEPA